MVSLQKLILRYYLKFFNSTDRTRPVRTNKKFTLRQLVISNQVNYRMTMR